MSKEKTLTAEENFIEKITLYLGNDPIAHAYANDIIRFAEDFHQQKLNEITDEDYDKSLDILTLVNSDEYKNQEFIYDQHMMIKNTLNG